MSVRAKFRVTNAQPFAGPDGKANGWKVQLTPVYDSNKESENGRFYQATPWGEIVLGTVNPDAAAQFSIGAEMYVDFTPVAA